MLALRLLTALLVVGWVSTASAGEFAYETVGAYGDNDIMDFSSAACNNPEGCYAKGGLPCAAGERCDYAVVPAGRCSAGAEETGCIWPDGAGRCVSNSLVACIPGCVNPENPANSSGKPCDPSAAQNTAAGCYGDEVCGAAFDPDTGGFPAGVAGIGGSAGTNDGYASQAFCGDLASNACDIDPDAVAGSAPLNDGNRDDCLCQGTQVAPPGCTDVAGNADVCDNYEADVCDAIGGAGGDSQARCSDGDPTLLIGGTAGGLCVDIGGGRSNCGASNTGPGVIENPKFPFENPPDLSTAQRRPGSSLGDPVADGPILDLRTTVAYFIEESGDIAQGGTPCDADVTNVGFCYETGKIIQTRQSAYWPDASIAAGAVTASAAGDANITVRYCNPPIGWDTTDPVTDPVANTFCSEQASYNGLGFIQIRDLTAGEKAAPSTCPPHCKENQDFHTGEQEQGDNLVGTTQPRAAAQLLFDNLEGPWGQKGSASIFQPLVAHTWIQGDFRCELSGAANAGVCFNDRSACDLTAALGTACPGSFCLPCDGTCTSEAACPDAKAFNDAVFPGMTFRDEGQPNGAPIGFDPGEFETLALNAGNGPNGGRIGIVGGIPSFVRTPLAIVLTTGGLRGEFADNATDCTPPTGTCALGDADPGTANAGIGTGGTFASTFVPPLDPANGPLGTAAIWAAESPPSGGPFVTLYDYAPGADAIPGCTGDNDANDPDASGSCSQKLGDPGAPGSTGADDAPLTDDFADEGDPADIRNAVLGRFRVAQPEARAPMFTFANATTLRNFTVLQANDTDATTKGWTTWCPLVGACVGGGNPGDACLVDADCSGGGDCDGYVRTCCQGDTLSGDSDGDTLCDNIDPCDSYPNTLPVNGGGDTDPNGDRNNDNVPNECQCGDANGDGQINNGDAFIIATCASPAGCNAQAFDVGLGDANNSGTWQNGDAFSVAFSAAPGGPPNYTLTCPRRPEGTDPLAP